MASGKVQVMYSYHKLPLKGYLFLRTQDPLVKKNFGQFPLASQILHRQESPYGWQFASGVPKTLGKNRAWSAARSFPNLAYFPPRGFAQNLGYAESLCGGHVK